MEPPAGPAAAVARSAGMCRDTAASQRPPTWPSLPGGGDQDQGDQGVQGVQVDQGDQGDQVVQGDQGVQTPPLQQVDHSLTCHSRNTTKVQKQTGPAHCGPPQVQVHLSHVRTPAEPSWSSGPQTEPDGTKPGQFELDPGVM